MVRTGDRQRVDLPDGHVLARHDVVDSGERGQVLPVCRPGEHQSVATHLGGILETGAEHVAEHGVVPSGVEISHHHP